MLPGGLSYIEENPHDSHTVILSSYQSYPHGRPLILSNFCIPPQSRTVWKGLQWDSSALQQPRRSHLPPPRHPRSNLDLSRSRPKILRCNAPLLVVKSWLKRGKHLNPHVCSCMHLQIDQPLSIFHCPSSLSLIMYLKKKALLPKVQKFRLHLGYQLLPFLIHLLHRSATVRQKVKGIQVLLVFCPVPSLMAWTGKNFPTKNGNPPGNIGEWFSNFHSF